MRARSPNPLRAPRSPSAARLALASVPVLGNSFWPSTYLSVAGWVAESVGTDVSTGVGTAGWVGVVGCSGCTGVTGCSGVSGVDGTGAGSGLGSGLGSSVVSAS